jgi:hypothetical protein
MAGGSTAWGVFADLAGLRSALVGAAALLFASLVAAWRWPLRGLS